MRKIKRKVSQWGSSCAALSRPLRIPPEPDCATLRQPTRFHIQRLERASHPLLTLTAGFINLAAMEAHAATATKTRPTPVFALACWFLAIVVLCQLLIAGLALANRFDAAQEVKIIEIEVEKLVPIELPAPPPVEIPVIVRQPDPEHILSSPAPSPTPLSIPEIADARAERLVLEARQARVAGDMGMAILKLEEALVHAEDEPAVHYEMGLVHEQMGVFDTAAAYYERVFQAGISGAGNLYELAAAKLRDGFEQPADMLGKLSLARVRVFRDPEHSAGERVVLSVPVQKAPGVELDLNELEVIVTFFNRNDRGDIQQLQDPSWVRQNWLSEVFTWAGGEETLRMDYVIPRDDPRNAHLFGTLQYYGQVVTLLYQNEVLDVQAWPRDLAARIPRHSTHDEFGLPPEFFDPGLLPPDFDPDNPLLLPVLPEF